MPFLQDDEFFLLMDLATVGSYNPLAVGDMNDMRRYNHIPLDGLKQLHDCGVRTTMPFQFIWKETEIRPGIFDWSYLDNYVNTAAKAGMKTILFTTTAGYPDWFPDDWFVRTSTPGGYKVNRGVLSPWNLEAMQANNAMNKILMGRYSCKHCLVVSAQLTVGETVLLNEPAFYDPAAIRSYQEFSDTEELPNPSDNMTNTWLRESYLNMLVYQQSLLAKNEFKEIFVMLHPAIADMGFYGNGCNWISDILAELTRKIEGVKINHIYYTWIQWTGYWQKMNHWRQLFDENVFGGAEYAEGLPVTTPTAIQNGLRGQIIAPCYPEIHDHLEPWMLENIRNAQNTWMSARAVH